MDVDLDRSLERQHRGLRAVLGVMAASSPGAHLVEIPGVLASVVPVTPTHSIPNSVVYEEAGALEAALPDLASRYDEAGVEAWTVWVPERDRAAAELLGGAGHVLDAEPAAMDLELDQLEPAPPGVEPLRWDREVSGPEIGRLNDHAYGIDHPAFALLLEYPPERDELRLYRVRAGEDDACVLATVDAGDDCVIFFVATHREHRGRGLARELLRVALLEARDRGLRTSSLQATRLGRPVYERLGYRTVCTLEMWERRRSAEAD